MKRVKVKQSCPNPLFECWLQEWKDEAANKGSDMQYCFSKALNTLKKYPLPLDSGKDCIILQHFGTKLCSMLDRKLKEYRQQSTKSFNNVIKYVENDIDVDKSTKQNTKKKSDTSVIAEKHVSPDSLNKQYVPACRSGGYAILLTLYNKTKKSDYIGYMCKKSIEEDAQVLCDKSFKRPDPGSYYTAWSSMSTLITKGLVIKFSNPAKYKLTDQGLALAMKLSEVDKYESQSTSSYNEGKSTVTKASKVKVHSLSLSDSDNPDYSGNVYTDLKELDLPNLSPEINTKALTCLESRTTNNYCNDAIDVLEIESSPEQLSESLEPVVYINTKSSNEYALENHLQITDKITSNKMNKSKETERNAVLQIENIVTQSPSSPTSTLMKNSWNCEPNTFDIILLVDTQETAGGKTKPKDDATIAELSQTKVLFEIRHLKVGDFTWIARCRKTNNELILPYIVERKRIDDLSSSIRDGRFHEQKFRLKQSGIENLIYMVESHGNNKHTVIPLTTLLQAAVNSMVQEGFTVKYTNSHRDSMLYLATLTRILTQTYEKKHLICCKKENVVTNNIMSRTIALMDFNLFNKSASKTKNFKVKEMLIRQLLQLKGLSVEKALAIVEKYPTPRILSESLNNAKHDGDKLLASIQCGYMKRQLGPTISRTVYQLYTKRTLS
ncbi:crossover junction endonuclease MUS81 [Cephus cinctus]|uniref:Crossover junction endonuclease MUS81 n=1 Tax=Cephus cinctus TaxID=211228 RepID=A0AAJ7FUU7_CEPCN|nr:crossover junction endonuclease MUS81 [Cephus cinctus]XP_015609412.1 crossover junction endonuclease MUS81 [Cephus cinctus]